MDASGTCPVCFLDLKPGIPLNVHLETHPKEMIVKAFMKVLDFTQGTSSGSTTTPATEETSTKATEASPKKEPPPVYVHSFQATPTFYQESPALPVLESKPHLVAANYFQDSFGNILLCPEYTPGQIETLDVNSPSTSTSATKSTPKILSISVVESTETLTWADLPASNPLSPNAILPKKLVKKQQDTATQEQSPVKPVATSVIKLTPECIPKTPTTDLAVETVAAAATESRPNPTSPRPSTSGVSRQSSSVTTKIIGSTPKAPKIIKVTFKKPVVAETASTNALPVTEGEDVVRSTSKSSEEEAATEEVTNVQNEETEREAEVDPKPPCEPGNAKEEDLVAAGLLQLKAGACEEVFISQHSLIKLEEGEYETPEDGHMGALINQSKESVELEMMAVAGPSSRNLSQDSSKYLDDLCLSESSISSVSDSGQAPVNVNIRAEEVMPAKGEISEQESNADSELLWPSSAAVETFETSRILPSYETSVARESWNFGHANSCDNLTFNGIPRMASMINDIDEEEEEDVNQEGDDEGEDDDEDELEEDEEEEEDRKNVAAVPLEPSNAEAGPSNPTEQASTSDAQPPVRRLRPYRCPGCPESFRLFRQRKNHMITHHMELLSKKQRYNYMRQLKDMQLPAVDGIELGTGTGAGLSEEPHKRRIEQLSVIKFHRFLIDANFRVLNEITEGQTSSMQALLQDFNQRRMYFCTECKQQFTTMREYRRHMVVHPIRCFQCEKAKVLKAVKVEEETGQGSSSSGGVPSSAEVVPKTEALAEVDESEVEDITDRVFWNWNRFVGHMKQHLNLVNSFTCKICTSRFPNQRKLAVHVASVHCNRAYQCSLCQRQFMQYSRLKEHRERHHFMVNKAAAKAGIRLTGASKKLDFLCPCGEVFQSAAKFAWHMETHEKNPQGCPFCRERFVHKNSLSRHIRLAHPDQYAKYKTDTVPCPVCQHHFIRTSLKAHLASHVKKTEFPCTICNKVLSTKWNLKMHKATHNSRSQMPFKCALCPKAYLREGDLQTHVMVHKNVKPYTCNHCGCQFSRKYNWLRHTREHEVDKKFDCGVCGKSFHRAYYLKEHERSHTNERPFECTICGKTSTTKTNHNKHLKIHHARDVTATEG